MAKEAVNPSSKYSLVRAIATLLKLGDEGKLESFFGKQRKNMTRDISKLDQQEKNLVFNYEAAVEELDEQIEDAQTAVDNAYMNVDVTAIGTNAEQDSYSNEYWSGIELAESRLDLLETKKEDLEEAHEKALEEIREQIAERKRRMARISATK